MCLYFINVYNLHNLLLTNFNNFDILKNIYNFN